jgi:hypothetical protein
MTHQMTEDGNFQLSHDARVTPRKGFLAFLNKLAGMDFNKVIIQEIDAPAASGSALLHAAITLTAGTPTTSAGIAALDVPRVLSVSGVAGTEAGNVVITGKNIEDDTIVDTIVVSGSPVVPGTMAFKSVSSIKTPAWTSGSAGGEKVTIGTTDSLGLENRLSIDSIFMTSVGGAGETTRPTVHVDADDIELNFAKPYTACDGAKDVVFAYLKM